MDQNASSRITTITLIAGGYALVRIVLEVFGQYAPGSIWYLLALAAGLAGLLWWQQKISSAPATADTSNARTLHLIALTIVVIALVMDAARLLMAAFR